MNGKREEVKWACPKRSDTDFAKLVEDDMRFSHSHK